MRWIPEYLVKNVSYSNDAQTLYIDLPKNEQISHLHVEVSATNDATLLTTTTLIDAIDSYQVMLEGSGVLYNLSPEMAYYVDFITRGGIYPPMGFNYAPSARTTHEFVIPFGRHLFDEEYYLDTGPYQSVQLRIPYDISHARWSSGSFRVNVVMFRPMRKLSGTGVIRSRLIRSETPSAAVATLMHDLPMTYPLRYVALRLEDLDKNISAGLTSAKVNIDEGRLVLADLNVNEWLDLDQHRWPAISGYKILAALSNETMVKTNTDYPYARAIVSSATRALIFKLYWAIGEQTGLNVYEAAGTAVSDYHSIDLHVSGSNPHKCLTIIDGRDEPFPAPSYSQGKIEYTIASQTHTFHTFVQEVVAGRL